MDNKEYNNVIELVEVSDDVGSVAALKIAHKRKIDKNNQAKLLFDRVGYACSKIVTESYSTSFSIGVRCLNPSIRQAIYSIYGFVRFADEIVDSFHQYKKVELLDDFENDLYKSLSDGISLNPILNSFQHTVKKYDIQEDLIRAFLKSMRADLYKKSYNEQELKQYIYGSADVVGLMCLKVFVDGDQRMYNDLKYSASKLGSAFQKVNFLRDVKDDTEELHRSYFPQLRYSVLEEDSKHAILTDIYQDYKIALEGIKKLPKKARLVFILLMYIIWV
ncbi:phytoene/squalene synthase family protein [Saccharicrinis fermentans]|uniref:Dehydrosqualene synthase n=1 Tax=Saccharicrinis fermentans DSM 9555 = JCM 21142 TaxID=869213 RepID=W7Y6E0_9BACT|nr:squalene/phytoene synthase family protein [Saccharicrinis fermentans]GAF03188.1 dehydrosqualene synthase [Saccharicrinis fermentans DSM 9555 = JCM 21142]